MSADGRFVVTWTTSQLASPASYEIKGRLYYANGVARGPEFRVNTYSTNWQTNDAVAMDDDGNFVVVWTSKSQDGSDDGVFGQRFSPAGGRLGAEFQVNQSTLGAQVRPAVTTTGAGAFVVAWEDTGRIFARRYDSAGTSIGAEFQVSTTANAGVPSIDADAVGNFVVVWHGGTPQSTAHGQRFQASGAPLGVEFLVNAGSFGVMPDVGSAPDGSFVVAFQGLGSDAFTDVFARRFDAAGVPVSGDLLVNQFTTGVQRHPQIAVDHDGDFTVTWTGPDRIDPFRRDAYARRLEINGTSGQEFVVNSPTRYGHYPSIGADRAGNFVVTWRTARTTGLQDVDARRYAAGLMGVQMGVDTASGPSADGNGVLEAGEIVDVNPAWMNANSTPHAFSGTASAFTGPVNTAGDPAYAIVDSAAAYVVAGGAIGECAATGDCFALGVSAPSTRPVAHWDAAFREEIAPAALGGLRSWTLHVGDSFSDVPRSNTFYRFIETILHRQITNGCTATAYCPSLPTTREQMAVFVLVAKEGPTYRPPPCVVPFFYDIPITHPFCPWIHELVRRAVVGSCGFGNYCPTAPVTREEMSVFMLVTRDPGATPPACGVPVFTDVPASNPFCRWIEELARRGIVAGCGGGRYCPSSPVSREQMGVFLAGTFGLSLYGP